ncbi:MAG: hypothetical protein ABR587_03420 [Candidatus Binatia bacterium]
MSNLLDRAIVAHGGLDAWKEIEEIEVELETGGLAFTAHGRPAFRGRAVVQASCNQVKLMPYGGGSGVFAGDSVEIVDGRPLPRRRQDPRTIIRRGRHRFVWDELDHLYFLGYALSNYIRAPFLFAQPGFSFEECGATGEGDEHRDLLRVRFPPDQHTHCREQTFYFDGRGLLRRLDYVAEPISRWARAAHFCDDYRSFDGLRIPTRRRVFPLMGGTIVLPAPLLVWIHIRSVTVRKGRRFG